MNPVIDVEDLAVDTLGGAPVLARARLAVAKGQVVAIVGPSGAGKTTLLRTIVGALPAGLAHRGGHVRVLGHDMLRLPPGQLRRVRREHLSYVAQDPASRLNPRMRVRRLLTEVAADRSEAALRSVLAQVRLPPTDDMLARHPAQLSGGQQRRVALARAIVSQPEVLLLDEPSAGLDHRLRDEIADLLRELADDHGLAIALSCHDRVLVDRLADEVIKLPQLGRAGAAVAGAVPLATLAGSPLHPPRSDPPGSGSALVVRSLSAWVGSGRRRRQILHEVSLEVTDGTCLAVVGTSGAGKTTLARAVTGLHRSAQGKVVLHGNPLPTSLARRNADQRRRLQLVPQDPLGALNPSRTVGATVGRPLRRHRRVARSGVAERVETLLNDVGLPTAFADRYPHELSGGQRQRVSIARALAAEPDVLVCDEVTSALDHSTAAAIMTLLSKLRLTHRLALILISHDLQLVVEYSDTVLVLDDGHAVTSGSATTVLTGLTAEPTLSGRAMEVE